jgi:hypothetical protein
MNDIPVTELLRPAAVARLDRAKTGWTDATIAYLRGDLDAPERTAAALEELNAARTELRLNDSEIASE